MNTLRLTPEEALGAEAILCFQFVTSTHVLKGFSEVVITEHPEAPWLRSIRGRHPDLQRARAMLQLHPTKGQVRYSAEPPEYTWRKALQPSQSLCAITLRFQQDGKPQILRMEGSPDINISTHQRIEGTLFIEKKPPAQGKG